MTAQALDAAEWAYTTRTFQALEHRFAVRTDEPELGRLVDTMYSSCAVSVEPKTVYSVVSGAIRDVDRGVYVDEELALPAYDPSWVARFLTWHVNQAVIGRSSRYVLLHAGMVARRGCGVVLPGRPEAGKTTLVAGLIRNGFGYVTDEAVAIDPVDLEVAPYPKPLSIDRGSWPVLPDFDPITHGSDARYHSGQWHVNPATIRPNAIAGRTPISVVAFPRFQAGATTVLEPITRAQTLLELAGETFRFHEAGRRNLRTLGEVVRQATCYRLVSGDLEEACALVGDAVGCLVGSNTEEP
jgi:hypothetical protein